MRIHSHAAAAQRRYRGQLFSQFPVIVEQFIRSIALHPVFQDAQMLGITAHIVNGNLMGTPCSLHRLAVNFFRTGPAFWSTQDQQWPARTFYILLLARLLLDAMNLFDNAVERRRHQLVHLRRIATSDENWAIAISPEQFEELIVVNAG